MDVGDYRLESPAVVQRRKEQGLNWGASVGEGRKGLNETETWRKTGRSSRERGKARFGKGSSRDMSGEGLRPASQRSVSSTPPASCSSQRQGPPPTGHPV